MPVGPDGCTRGAQNPRSQVIQPQALTYKGHHFSYQNVKPRRAVRNASMEAWPRAGPLAGAKNPPRLES